MLRFTRRRGQGTLEYAALIACIVAAVLVMQRYFNRAAQGRWKSAADQVGEQFDFGKTDHTYSFSSDSKSTEKLDGGSYSSDIDHSNYEKKDSVYTVGK